jgi:metal-responsive CopG/Arc/MetJ family transcriptional regulator
MPDTKKKIQLSLSEKTLDRLEELSVALGYVSNSAIVSIAIEKYYWEVSKEQSNKPISKKEGEQMELINNHNNEIGGQPIE